MLTKIIPLLISAILILATALASFIDKSFENKNNGKKNTSNLVIFFTALMGIGLGFYTGYNSISDKIKSDRIVLSTKENVVHLSDSLIQAKTKIVRLQDEIISNIIGSQKPCFLEFTKSSKTKILIRLVNTDTLPIYGMDIYLSKFLDLMNCKRSYQDTVIIFDENCYWSCTDKIINNIYKPGKTSLGEIDFPDTSKILLYEVRFTTNKNVEYLEQLVCVRKENKIICSGRIMKLNKNQYDIIENIDTKPMPQQRFAYDSLFNLPKVSRAFNPITWR